MVVALAPTEETAEAAGRWAAETAERFIGGTWVSSTEPTGVADCHVVRLVGTGSPLDPGKPLT